MAMKRIWSGFGAAALLFSTFLATTAAAQTGPVAVLFTPDVPAPADTPYPGGTITLDVDARDTIRGIFKVTETIPLAANTRRITLLYPEWLQGNHAPRGPINQIGALKFTVGGRPVKWWRDPADVFAIHVDLPGGGSELVATFVHTAPLESAQGRITMTQEMLSLQWEKMSFYPAGHYARQIRVKPSVSLPEGWTAAAALDGMAAAPGRVSWADTDYETLVDSPLLAGSNFRRWDLGHSVAFNVVSDSDDQLDLAPANAATLSAMIDEALLIFGTPPFDRYEFLVSATSRMGGIGLEHQRSNESQIDPRTLTDWAAGDYDRNVLTHEFVHSWDGKFRRPAGLWAPDFRQPTDNRLLWVYEGQTQFWGYVLAARSGVQSKQMVLDMIARTAGSLAEEPGRDWRSVTDTTYDPVIDARRPRPYTSLMRGEDYYVEGAMVWLEADQIIRQGTKGARGLDDFAKAFFSYPGGGLRQKTYTRDDVIATLTSVYAYDWAGFLAKRIDEAGLPAPLAGIEKAGYKLVFREEPNGYDKARMAHDHDFNLSHSLGLVLDGDGKVTSSKWDSAAFKAGIVTGAKIIAVNDNPYSSDILRRAITSAKTGRKPIMLLIKRNEHFQTVPLDYHDGLRWPWLERVGKAETGLDRLLAPRRAAAP